MKTAMQMWTRLGIAPRKIIMTTTKVDLAPEKPFQFIYKTKVIMYLNEDGMYIHMF